MIFGIKTRKDLKKEIEELTKESKDLKKRLDEAAFDVPLQRVKVVLDNRTVQKVEAVLEISDYAARNIPDDCIMEMIQSKIAEELRKYITIQSYHDPMELVHMVKGTLEVVVPK